MCAFLFVQFPGGTFLGVFHGKAEFCQAVANLVARGPVFVGFGLGCSRRAEIHAPGKGFFAFGVAAFFAAEAENVETEGVEHAFQGFETFGR